MRQRKRRGQTAMVRSGTLDNLLVDELRGLYSAERQLAKVLPRLARGAESGDLRTAFTAHLAETLAHVRRIEKSLRLLHVVVRAKTCAVMQGLVRDSVQQLEVHHGHGLVLDAALINAAQKTDHYQMASYATVIAQARVLRRHDIAELLTATLNEVKAADRLLGRIAEDANRDAPARPDDGRPFGKAAGAGRTTPPGRGVASTVHRTARHDAALPR